MQHQTTRKDTETRDGTKGDAITNITLQIQKTNNNISKIKGIIDDESITSLMLMKPAAIETAIDLPRDVLIPAMQMILDSLTATLKDQIKQLSDITI